MAVKYCIFNPSYSLYNTELMIYQTKNQYLDPGIFLKEFRNLGLWDSELQIQLLFSIEIPVSDSNQNELEAQRITRAHGVT